MNKPTAKQIFDNADSTAFNFNTRELLARCGQWGAVIKEDDSSEEGYDFDNGVVTPLSEWAVQDF